MAGKTTERRGASAARRLLHHRERLAGMERRMYENAAVLETFLVASGDARVVLPGGYVLTRGDEGGTGESVEVRRIAAENGFEQLGLDTAFCPTNRSYSEQRVLAWRKGNIVMSRPVNLPRELSKTSLASRSLAVECSCASSSNPRLRFSRRSYRRTRQLAIHHYHYR